MTEHISAATSAVNPIEQQQSSLDGTRRLRPPALITATVGLVLLAATGCTANAHEDPAKPRTFAAQERDFERNGAHEIASGIGDAVVAIHPPHDDQTPLSKWSLKQGESVTFIYDGPSRKAATLALLESVQDATVLSGVLQQSNSGAGSMEVSEASTSARAIKIAGIDSRKWAVYELPADFDK